MNNAIELVYDVYATALNPYFIPAANPGIRVDVPVILSIVLVGPVAGFAVTMYLVILFVFAMEGALNETSNV